MPRPSVTSPATTAGVTPPAVKAAPRLDLTEVQPGPAAVKTAGTSRPDAPNDWVFFDNRWVPVLRPSSMAPLASGADAGTDLVTQRVIEIPVQPLINGSARHNIVIRPGDIIRVPPLPEGVVYVGGQVARPGTYNLPATGKLTLHRAVVAAGGLNSTAIPERTEIIRMVGPDRQAIVRLNLRAIAEGTQPDLVLKPDDQINVGTNFWAFPLAVIRQGFRFSYGFGFILDRNFGTEIYGPQQTQGF